MMNNTTRFPVPPASLLARRRWLKGAGALLGLAVLAAPAQVLALAPAITNGAEPIGTVMLLSGTLVPQGWTRCNGRVLLVADHPALFAALGAAHGGDGTHSFALPNLGEPASAIPGALAMQFAIKTSSGPAVTTALAKLRLTRQPRAQQA